jgi:hypothetical protein
MKRIKLIGWFSEEKQNIKAEHRATATHGTIDKAYIRREKIKEMEENGFAYVNKPIEFMV